jgi:hypothetical protein
MYFEPIGKPYVVCVRMACCGEYFEVLRYSDSKVDTTV